MSEGSTVSRPGTVLFSGSDVMTSMTLRPVTLRDAEILLAWRNDASTRLASHETSEVKLDEHLQWLTGVLSNPSRVLMIAEEDGAPIGTVRADLHEDIRELSWTISPSARGRGLAKRMVKMFADSLPGKIKAEIREKNIASIQVAEAAGMIFDHAGDGILHYSRL